MSTERKAANAMAGRTARACDGCLSKRARWFCAADDAFLCQACDSSVHSANQLARRHERVRLQTSSSSSSSSQFSSSKNITTAVMNNSDGQSPPAWHQGITRKARTPRHSNNNNKAMSAQQKAKDDDQEEKFFNRFHLVPEIGSEEDGHTFPDEDDEDRLLYRVPVFDPFAAELNHDMLGIEETETAMENKEGIDIMVLHGCSEHEGAFNSVDDLPGFLSSDVDLAEFAVDVENLLGPDKDSPDLNDLGLFDCKEEDNGNFCFEEKVKKVKDEPEVEAITACGYFDMTRGSLNWNFSHDHQSLVAADEEEKEKVMISSVAKTNAEYCEKEMRRSISLRLNYEAVITAWASQGSPPPWITGSRPEIHANDCWPRCMGTCPKEVHQFCGDIRGHHMMTGDDGGREARVLRYKEKRRTRLFSKKIRYEVRKLNAEKRPRMKGRFVKRTSSSFMGTSAFPFFNS